MRISRALEIVLLGGALLAQGLAATEHATAEEGARAEEEQSTQSRFDEWSSIDSKLRKCLDAASSYSEETDCLDQALESLDSLTANRIKKIVEDAEFVTEMIAKHGEQAVSRAAWFGSTYGLNNLCGKLKDLPQQQLAILRLRELHCDLYGDALWFATLEQSVQFLACQEELASARAEQILEIHESLNEKRQRIIDAKLDSGPASMSGQE